jgi:hypothetical protein
MSTPSTDPLNSGGAVLPADHVRISGLTLVEAEDLLDWLEQNEYQDRALMCESEQLFAVQFRIDAAHPFTQTSRLTHFMRVRVPDQAQVPHGS